MRYFREDTGQAWEDFNALRQTAMTSLGSMERMIERLRINGKDVTLAMMAEFIQSLNAQKIWWANLKAVEPGKRSFTVVTAAGIKRPPEV